jgi:MFS family permease
MFVVEFQNAFSDNVLRWLVSFLIVGMGLSLEKRDSLVPLVGAIFALPFVLFSMAGGFFADRYSKRTSPLPSNAPSSASYPRRRSACGSTAFP